MKAGCVYFIKHKKLNGIKIGMSNSPDPKKRISQIETASPYGIELLYTIITSVPNKLESYLHNVLADKRLNGEWFNVSKIEVSNICKQLKERKIDNIDVIIITKGSTPFVKSTNNFGLFKSIESTGVKITSTDLAKTFGVTRATIHRWRRLVKCNIV